MIDGKIEIREDDKRKRGDFLETIVRDTTRVGHPPAASIFECGDLIVVVPENPEFPVMQRTSLGDAIGYVERIIPDEEKRHFA